MSHPETHCDYPARARDEALCRSVFYGAISLALHYPTEETCTRLLSEDTALALRDAASWLAAVPLSPGTAESSTRRELVVDLNLGVTEWVQTFPSLTLQRLRTFHGRLFGHTARGGACPYETEYGQEALFQQPRQLAEIRGFYEAFGLTTRGDERERADHASCELEFLDFLSRKEAYAIESGDDAMLRETRKAIRLFLKEHVGRFAPAFARSLCERDESGYFGRLGNLLRDFIVLECRRLQVEAGPARLELRSTEDDKLPMGCGERPESELIQLEIPERAEVSRRS